MSDTTRETARPPASSGAPVVDGGAIGGSPRLRAEDSSGAPGYGAVVVRVLDPDGAPVPGARLALQRDPESPIDEAWTDDDSRRLRAVTDGDGRARLVLEFGGVWDATTETLRVRAEGFAPAARGGVEICAGEEADAGEVRLAPGRSIAGHVVDVEGLPAAGLPVWVETARDPRRLRIDPEGDLDGDFPARLPAGWAPAHAVRTDADGRFTVDHAPDRAVTLRVLASPAAVVTRDLPADWTASPVAPIEIALPALRPLRGRVVGTPRPPGLRASVGRLIEGERWVPVGLDGMFDLGPVVDGEVSVTVWTAAAYALGSTPADTRVLDGPIEVEIAAEGAAPEGAVVRGQVFADGAPLARFSVAMVPLVETTGAWGLHPPEEFRDPEGRFEIDGLSAGRWLAWVRARGRAGVRVPVVIGEEARATPELRVDLPAAGPDLQGFVRQADGTPVAGVWVEVFERQRVGPGPAWLAPAPHSHARTDAGGRFRLSAVGPAPVSLAVHHRESAEPTVVYDVTAGGEPIEITLPAAARLRVIVRSARGRPVPGVDVSVTPLDAGARADAAAHDDEPAGARWFRTLADGTATVAVAAPGPHRVALRGIGTAAAARTVDLAVGLAVDIELWLPAPGRVVGRIADLPADARDPRVTLHAVASTATGEPAPVASVDTDGSFALEDVPPGRYRAWLACEQGPRGPLGEVEVRSDATTELTATCPPPAPAPPVPAPTDGPLIGRVVGTSDKFDLVMVDIGARRGLTAGTVLRVERDGQPIARLQVSNTFPDMAAATTLENLGRGPVQRGDRVVVE